MVLIRIIQSHVRIVTCTGIVTYKTIVGTQFQIVNPRDWLHEVFLGYYPAGTDTAEVTPTAFLGKA